MGLDEKFTFIPCDEEEQIFEAENYTKLPYHYTDICRNRAKWNRKKSKINRKR